MRYTHKLDKSDSNCNYFLIPDKEQCDSAENKLGQLEDVEEELGIDLITLFKLINAENIYSYGHTNIMKSTCQVDIYDKTITIWNGSCHQVYPLSEYGKSFALTKEELE